MNPNTINVLTLAYLGDVIYEQYIRKHFIKQGIAKVNDLQKIVTKYVSAKGQAHFLTKMLEQGVLSEEEIDIIKRARNHKGNRHPKHTDILTYKHATGLESLIGYLHLEEKHVRIEELMEMIVVIGKEEIEIRG